MSILTKISEKLDKVQGEVTSVQASVRSHEVQIGQLASQAPRLPPGMLPVNIVAPTEHAKAITTRSGLVLDEPTSGSASGEAVVAKEVPSTIPVPIVLPPTKATIGRSEEEKRKAKMAEDELHARVPFPQRLRKYEEETSFKKFVDTIRKLHINIPFADAIAQMPRYAKFLKELLTNKKKLDDFATIVMGEECSAVIQRPLPQKKKDPGSFVLPVCLGGTFKGNGLCDLGASINLMPTSVFRQLGVDDLRPTHMCLQMADRSIKRPRGVIEDVLVRVGGLILPADFVVLDMEADEDVPLILGRPFLATGRTIINVAGGILTMCVNDEVAAFEVFKPTTIPVIEENVPCYQATGTPTERHDALKERIIGELDRMGVKEKEHLLGELERKRLAKKPKEKKKKNFDEEEEGSKLKEKEMAGFENPNPGNLKLAGGDHLFPAPYMD